ncbi:hypothetical protein KCU60_g4396, partial [Aureobasidium melanogenum]
MWATTFKLNKPTIWKHDNSLSLFSIWSLLSITSVMLFSILVSVVLFDYTPDLNASLHHTISPSEAHTPPAPA